MRQRSLLFFSSFLCFAAVASAGANGILPATSLENSATTTSVPATLSPALIALALSVVGLGGFAARRNAGGLPKTLALAVVLLLPFGFGAQWLPARPQDRPGSGSSGVPPMPPSSLTLLARAQISVTASGLAYSRVSQTFKGTVTITNVSARPINGPFHVFIKSPAAMRTADSAAGGTPAGGSSAQHKPVPATLANATGNFGGFSYVTVPNVGSLTPGQSATANVHFRNPSNAAINFTPVIYSGSIN